MQTKQKMKELLTPGNIKEIQENAREAEWPNHNFRKAVIEQTKKLNEQTDAVPEYNNPQLSKTALYKHDIILDTNNDLKNTATDAISNLVNPFRPNITVLGQGLIDEKNSQSWGGMFYRVLGDKNTYEESTKVVVQYIYTWIRQKLPITFWNCVLPLIALLCISIFINTDTQIYSSNLESIEGVPSEIATILTTKIYILSSILVVSFLLGISAWELYKAKKKHNRSVRMYIFPILAILYFGFFILELGLGLLDLSSYNVIYLEYFINNSDIAILTIRLGLVSMLLALVILISMLILKYQELVLRLGLVEKMFDRINVHVSHDMDYAPIFIYCSRQNPSNRWNVNRIVWDKLHYCIDYQEAQGKKGQGIINRFRNRDSIISDRTEKPTRPNFVMKGNWHPFEAFSLWRQNILNFLWILSILVFLFLIGIGTGLTVTNFNLFVLIEESISRLFGEAIGTILTTIIYRLVYPFVVFWSVYFVFNRRRGDLPDDQNLEEVRYYYLNSDKLTVLWNLPSEAQFLIQEKLQNPSILLNNFLSFYNSDIETKKNATEICTEGKKDKKDEEREDEDD